MYLIIQYISSSPLFSSHQSLTSTQRQHERDEEKAFFSLHSYRTPTEKKEKKKKSTN